MMRPRSPLLLSALVAVLALLVGGCGDDSGSGVEAGDGASTSTTPGETTEPTPSETSEPTPSETVKTEPTCDSVWVEDAVLERTYRGCYNGEKWVKVRPIFCSFGGKIVTYDGRFWALPGREIHLADPNLRKDPEFQQALRKCTA